MFNPPKPHKKKKGTTADAIQKVGEGRHGTNNPKQSAQFLRLASYYAWAANGVYPCDKSRAMAKKVSDYAEAFERKRTKRRAKY